MTDHEFRDRLLILMAEHDATEFLNWTSDLNFYIRCNDFFLWGCSDAEDITPDDLPLLEQSLIDAGPCDGPLLYCARKAKLRPQGAAYDCIDKEHWPMFDACGPVRPADFGNPENRPND